ncbi:Helix-turn-helix domain protein [Thermoplasmatales archaeon]|nr:Helix-turn-helix domain protein [Thermoplasmatales archaeon]
MDVFTALSDPTRRAVMDILSQKPLTAGEIGSHFSNLTQPGMSKHLGVLKKARLVKVTVKAQQRVYSLNREGFMELEEWISKYRVFWKANLDSLGEFLDSHGSED